MSNYYAKQEGKERIAEELIKRGWKVYDYSPSYFDEDPGCDYPYHAAHWGGLATKNGFVLCVDISGYNVKSMSGKKVYKYTENNISTVDYNKIEALKNMTQERGATENEEANAKSMIEKIYAKAEKADIERENSKILDYIYPTFQEHPTTGTKWHIEKDGSIFDKGNGLTTFAKVPDTREFNIDTMKYTEGYKYYYDYENCERVEKERILSEETEKAIKSFKNFILRIERVVNNMNGMGDGTKETEEAAKEQQNNEKLEKVITYVTKKVLKMVEVQRNYMQKDDFLTFSYHGGYWKVTEEYMRKGTWKGITEERKVFVYKIVGSASRGYKQLKNPKSYYNYEYQLLKNIEEGKVKIFELKEVEETTKVEKWVKQTIKKTPSTKKETVKFQSKENNKTTSKVSETPVTTTENNNTDTTITATITLNEAKNGVEIRFSDKPNSEIRTSMKSNSFRWGGKNNPCWFAKQSETTINFANELVNNINKVEFTNETIDTEKIDIIADEAINSIKVTEEFEENAMDDENNNPYEHDKIETSYTYSCHFKVWNYTIDEIKTKLKALNINYTDMGSKIGFENLDYETMLKIENLNNKNGSILFIDSKVKIQDPIITDKDKQTVENLLDYSVSIMDKLGLNHATYLNSQEYKNELIVAIKQNNIKLTKGVLKYLVNEGYEEFEKILKDILSNVISINKIIPLKNNIESNNYTNTSITNDINDTNNISQTAPISDINPTLNTNTPTTDKTPEEVIKQLFKDAMKEVIEEKIKEQIPSFDHEIKYKQAKIFDFSSYKHKKCN